MHNRDTIDPIAAYCKYQFDFLFKMSFNNNQSQNSVNNVQYLSQSVEHSSNDNDFYALRHQILGMYESSSSSSSSVGDVINRSLESNYTSTLTVESQSSNRKRKNRNSDIVISSRTRFMKSRNLVDENGKPVYINDVVFSNKRIIDALGEHESCLVCGLKIGEHILGAAGNVQESVFVVDKSTILGCPCKSSIKSPFNHYAHKSCVKEMYGSCSKFACRCEDF